MKIGVNLWLLSEDSGGIANYVMTLLRSWPKLFPQDQWVLYCFPQNESMLAEIPEDKMQQRVHLGNQEKISELWEPLDLYFCPFGSLWPRPVPMPSVVSLMDIQERFFPENFSSKDLESRLFHYGWSLRMCDRVIAISDFTKETFVRLLRVPKRKIDRIYLCPDELPAKARKPVNFPRLGFDDYGIYPANNWPHKNHDRLLQALRKLKDRGIEIPCIFTGSVLAEGFDIDQKIRKLGLEKQTVHLGRISRTEISWIYRNARLMLFPSQFEGFGIPLVEARSLGLPIVCSPHTSVHEAVDNEAVFCDPNSTDDMANSIAKAWHAAPSAALRDNNPPGIPPEFTEDRMLRQHRAVFQKAIRCYSPIRHWWRRKILVPRQFRNRQTVVSAREVEIARTMLDRSRHTRIFQTHL